MKKNFNIVCNCLNLSSYECFSYDARYFVNFGTLIDDEDYKKIIKLH